MPKQKQLSIRLLLANGAKVNEFGGHHKPLHHAAKTGQIEIAERLLANGADIEAKGMDEWTPLGIAAQHNQPEMVNFLLDRGADPTLKCSSHHVPNDFLKKIRNQ